MVSLTALGAPAFAQSLPTVPRPAPADTTDAAAPDANSTIVVTGSRIRSPDAASVSPVSTVGGAEIQARGATRIEDLINTLPQAYADQGGGNRGGTVGASGTATVNLRNLGNQRTLVLIDGRRLMQGDPARSSAQAADINNVPAALVDRIDIVTGGASAVYGSDAIAGVVNFVLKRNFDGIQADAQGGVFTHSNGSFIRSAAINANQPIYTGNNIDGGQQSLSLTAGKNFGDGRGNVTGFVGYRNIDGVGTAARDFSTCNLGAAATGYTCSLSSTTYPAQFQLTNPATGAVRGSYTIDGTTGDLRTYRTSDGFSNGPTYDLQAPDKRINADLFAHYKFSDAIEAYGEAMFMRDKADVRISPTGVFTVAESINCNNPFLTTQQRNLICTSVGLTPAQNATVNVSERNVQAGSRHDYTRHTSYRGVAGLRGEFAPGWRYDAYGQYGRTDYSSRVINDYSLARFAKALRAVTNSSGQIVCESVVNGTDPSCVPINLFAVGGVTQAALNYVQNTVYRTGYTEETVASGSVTGDLGFGSPLSTHPIGVALGAEYRDEKLSFQPDSFYSSRDVAGNSGGEFPITGSFNVKEVFGEMRVPLIEDRPFFHSLSAEAGIRYSHYSTAGNTTSYKAGAEWSPIADIRFRGSYQRAVRAPNLTELFGPQRGVTAAISDPCEGAAPRATAAQCALSGVSAVQYGSIAPAAGQQSGARVGGNPDLVPEIADTKSFGAQIMPRFLRGVTVGVDYFDIKVKRLITNVPAQITLNQCLSTGVFCSLIVRNPATGSLVNSGYVVTTSVNAGYLRTDGFDVTATVSQKLGDLFGGRDLGRIDMNFAGTHTGKYEVQILPGAPTYRCDGRFGVTCGQPTPHWRHRLLTSYTTPGGTFSISGTWRYIGATTNDKASSDVYLTGTFFPYDLKLKATSYYDLAIAVSVEKRLTLRMGVNNLFDHDPPLTASAASTGQTSNGAFFAGMYDALGRYLFAGATVRF